MWGDIIKAGASIASSLFGSGGDDDPARSNRKQTERLIKNKPALVRTGAEAAGFNPLTYLLSGASNASVSGAVGGQPSPLASFAAAIGQAADLFEQSTSDEQTEKAAASADRQFRRVQRDQQQAGGVGQVITRTIRGPKLAGDPDKVDPVQVLVGPDKLELSEDETVMKDGREMTSMRIAGHEVDPSGNWSDAELAEARYGELGGSLYGLGPLVADFRQSPLGQATSRTLWGPDKQTMAEAMKKIQQQEAENKKPRLSEEGVMSTARGGDMFLYPFNIHQ